jgi:hypothetical protein
MVYINPESEYALIQDLFSKIPKVDSIRTVVLNVSPDYSSIVAMQLAHHLSVEGKMLDLISVDVPYPKEDRLVYKERFEQISKDFKSKYDKIILVEAAVLSGNNYTWLTQCLRDIGYDDENIVTVSLLEMTTSIFKCDYVGEYVDSMPEFYWERYNIHWD